MVSGGFEARGATARFSSGAGAEDQHHQSPTGSHSGSLANEQAHGRPVGQRRQHQGCWP